MAQATGTITLSTTAPSKYSTITLDDGQSTPYSKVNFVILDDAWAGSYSRSVISGTATTGSSGNYHYSVGGGTGLGNGGGGVDYVALYRRNRTAANDRSYLYLTANYDLSNNSVNDWKNLWITSGSQPITLTVATTTGSINVNFYYEDGWSSSTVYNTSDSSNTWRKHGPNDYGVNIKNVTNSNHAYMTLGLYYVLYDAKNRGLLDIKKPSTAQSNRYLYVASVDTGNNHAPISFALNPSGSSTWNNGAGGYPHGASLNPDKKYLNKAPIAYYADDATSAYSSWKLAAPFISGAVVYSTRGAPTGGSDGNIATHAEFAEYWTQTINNLPIQISASVSGGTISLVNSVDGTSGNVTITSAIEAASSNISIAGMSGGSAAGGSIMALTKIGHKLLERSGVRRDAIQSGSIESLQLSQTDNFVFAKNIGVTGSIYATADLFVKDNKKVFFGDGKDVSLEYDEDGDDVLQIAGAHVRVGHGANTQLQFRDDGLYLHSSTNGQLDVIADVKAMITAPTAEIESSTSIQLDSPIVDFEDDGVVLQFGAGDGVSITHVASNDALRVNSDKKLEFRDATEFVHSDADGYMHMEGATGVNLAVNGSDVAQVTSAGLNVVGTLTGDTSLTLDAVTISTAEITVLDSAAANEVIGSKAVIYGSAGQLTGSAIAGNTVTIASTATFNGPVTLGNATSDDITITGRIAADIDPKVDNSYDLGASSLQWKDLYVNGTGYIDAVDGDSVTATGTISGSAGTFHTLTADHLDVQVINSTVRTDTTLEVADKLIVAAVDANSANSSGGGLKIGGDASSNGHASMLWDSTNSSLDFNIGGTTEIRLQDGVLRPETDNDVDLGASGAEFKDLWINGTANVDLLKLPDVTSGKMLVADGTSYEEVAISGDIAMASNGAVTIQDDAVEADMLNDNVISGQSALGSATAAQADEMLFSDAGTLKKITFSNLEDSIFGNVSGDATIAAGGALTIAADAVENTMLHKSVVLNSSGSNGGINFQNGVLSVGSHVIHFMSSSAPTGNTQLVSGTVAGSDGSGDATALTIYAITGSKGAGAVTASLGYGSADRGTGFPASGSLRVYLNGILLMGVRDYGACSRAASAAQPIGHGRFDYRWDDAIDSASPISGSRILLNPALALDSNDILTVEYLSGTVVGHHA